MAAIPRSVRFFRKAEAALLAAIELYNKPDFRYREESFAILALNAWELLLKAKLLAESSNRRQCLYFYEKRQTKRKTLSKKLYLRKNRSGNLQSISLGQVMTDLETKKSIRLSASIKRNLDGLVEIRDNAVHFINAGPRLSKQVLELTLLSKSPSITLSSLVPRLRSDRMERGERLTNLSIFAFTAPSKEKTFGLFWQAALGWKVRGLLLYGVCAK